MRVGIEYIGEPRATPPVGFLVGKSIDFLLQECIAYPGAAPFWLTFDDRVAAWEAAGYREVCVTLRCKHTRPDMTRPSVQPPAELASLAYAQASAPPVVWSEWERFVRECALRYAGRVTSWQIESEQTDETHWLGTASEYCRLFQVAQSAIAGRAPVVLGGIGFGDLLDDMAGRALDDQLATVEARIATWGEPYRAMGVRSLEFGRYILSALRPDAVGLHALSGVSGVTAGVEVLMALGPRGVAVWVDDATSAPLATYDPRGFNQPGEPWPMFVEMMKLLGNDKRAWARREAAQAEMVAAKIAAARVCGVDRIHFCSLADWPLTAASGALAFQALRAPALAVLRAAQ